MNTTDRPMYIATGSKKHPGKFAFYANGAIRRLGATEEAFFLHERKTRHIQLNDHAAKIAETVSKTLFGV
jgi:uncharacterized protein YhbP (UPF0306 family)